MKVFSSIACACAVLMLAGCGQHTYSNDQQMVLDRMVNRPITCHEGKDCKEKWRRATQWIVENPYFPATRMTGKMLQTRGEWLSGQYHPGFTVIKYETGNGVYALQFSTICDEGIKCNPPGIQRRADFMNFVLGLPRGVRQTGPGAYSMTVHTQD